MSLIIVGFFSAGKSSVGKRLSHTLELPFFDTDREIEKTHSGMTVFEIHRQVGEPTFRKIEASVVQNLISPSIISTGGGTILLSENREKLKSLGDVIYLKANLSTLIHRMINCRFPLYIDKENYERQLEEISKIRFPLYTEMADFIIETDTLSIDQVVKGCLSYVRQ